MLLKSFALIILIAILCAVTLYSAQIKHKTVLFTVISVVYLAVLLSFTLLYREDVTKTDVSTIPFNSFFQILTVGWYGWGKYIFMGIVGNMLLFVPLGMIVGNIFVSKHRVLISVISGFALSMTVECIQYVYELGVFEIDDLIINTWGAIIGCSVVIAILKREKSVLENIKTLMPLVVFAVVLFAFCVVPVSKEIIRLF